MSRTLDEMIAHEAGLADSAKRRGYEKTMERHNQIVKCLIELRERRKAPEIIRRKDCENWDTTWQNDSAPNYHYCPMIDGTYSGDFYCAKSERRTDADD